MYLSLDKEQIQIKKAAASFAAGEMTAEAQEWDAAARVPSSVVEKAVELGFVGMTLPERYGGAGLGLLEDCLVTEEFATASPGAARAMLEPGWGGELLQQVAELPPAMREAVQEGAPLGVLLPEEGVFRAPDAGSLPLTFAPVQANAEILLIPAAFRGKEGLFLLSRDPSSMQFLPLEEPVGLRSWPGARLHLTGDDLSEAHFVAFSGAAARSRQAKAIRSAALGLGLSRGAALLALAHARGRVIFDRSLSEFEATREKFFRVWQQLHAVRLMIYKAAGDWDKGLDVSLAARAAEAMAFRMAEETADEALQLHGGYGYFEEMKIAMFYRDAVMLELLSEPASASIETIWPSLAKTVWW